MNYGLQMYSVRDFAQNDLLGTLKKVAEIGYKDIEFAGFFGNSAEDIRATLDECGLVCNGTHTGIGELDNDFAAAVKFQHTIGSTNFIIPHADTSTKEAVDILIEKLNKYQPMLAAEGIKLAFHNHSGEFLPNKDGIIPHEEMQKRTNIEFEIDTCWAYVAGRDPVEVITTLKDRVHVIHLKDIIKNAEGKNEGRALGEGSAPVAAVYARAKELGMRMVVESENLNPDGLSEVTRCMNYLRSLEK